MKMIKFVKSQLNLTLQKLSNCYIEGSINRFFFGGIRHTYLFQPILTLGMKPVLKFDIQKAKPEFDEALILSGREAVESH